MGTRLESPALLSSSGPRAEAGCRLSSDPQKWDAISVFFSAAEKRETQSLWGLEGLYIRFTKQDGQWVTKSGLIEEAYEHPGLLRPDVCAAMESELVAGTCFYSERRARRWGLASKYGGNARWLRFVDDGVMVGLVDAVVEGVESSSSTALLIPFASIMPTHAVASSACIGTLLQGLCDYPCSSLADLQRRTSAILASPDTALQFGRQVLHCGSTIVELPDGDTATPSSSDVISDLPTLNFVKAVPSMNSSLLIAQADRFRFLDHLRDKGRAIVITGGALADPALYPTPFCSPRMAEICRCMGAALAENWVKFQSKGFSYIVTGSMAGGPDTVSFDYLLSEGFGKVLGVESPLLHFKDTNALRTGGDAWSIPYGQSIILQVDESDHSNNAKEFALLTMSEQALHIFGGGGPTVAQNLVRFAMLPRHSKGFALCAVHGSSRSSGATGAFFNRERLTRALESCKGLVGGKHGASFDLLISQALALEDPLVAVQQGLLCDLPKCMSLMCVSETGCSREPFPSVVDLIEHPVLADGFDETVSSEHIRNYCVDAVRMMLEQCD